MQTGKREFWIDHITYLSSFNRPSESQQNLQIRDAEEKASFNLDCVSNA